MVGHRACAISGKLLILLAVATACGPPIVQSIWRDRDVVIDGRDSEWTGARVLLDDARVGLGLINDRQCLYLTVSTTDPALQAQLFRQGFTVWFDPKGGRRETLGIRYPLGILATRRTPPGQNAAEPGDRQRGSDRQFTPRRPGGRGGFAMTPSHLEELYDQVSSIPEAEILGPRSGQVQRTLVAESKLMSVAMRYSKGRLVYELRIPLATCCGQSLSEMMDHGGYLGIGFLTPVPDRSTADRQTPRMGRRGAGISANDMPSVGGERGGGPKDAGRNSGAMRSPMFAPFKLWIKVRLQDAAG